ncbi:MAG: DUF1659 domain-containing protein [Romboutsia sp.]
MSLVVTKNPAGLKMKFDCGKNNEGKTIVKSRTYGNIRATATDQNIFDVASVIESLQSNNLMEIAKIDNTIISE